MSTWIESERELAEWLEHRFPGGGSVDERVARAERERLRRALPGVLIAFVLPFVAHGNGDRLFLGPGPVHGWQGIAWVLVGVVVLVAVVMDVHTGPSSTPQGHSRVLDALSRAERRELGEELRFRRPVVPGDEPVLQRLAVGMRRGRWVAWIVLGVAAVLLPAEVEDPAGRIGIVRVVLVAVYTLVAVKVFRSGQAGGRYLARAGSVPVRRPV